MLIWCSRNSNIHVFKCFIANFMLHEFGLSPAKKWQKKGISLDANFSPIKFPRVMIDQARQ
tara:strand:- start:487 stop:669 length:183 start_codon:yes stop_codon:yes gene_type:complete